MLTLAKSFSNRGHQVELIVFDNNGSFFKEIPDNTKLFNLESKRAIFALFPLLRYLRESNPDVMLSALGHVNIIAILSKIISRVKFRLVISEHAIQSTLAKKSKSPKEKIIPMLSKFFYRFADHVIAVSQGVADNLVSSRSVSSEKITTIYNPIIKSYKEKVDTKTVLSVNKNFDKSKYKMIGVGRLSPEKDYPTMLRSFEIVTKLVDIHLLILGEGEERLKIEKNIRELDLGNFVTLLGFVENPSLYIANCDLLCLSSISEGFGNVLIEALSVGTPVVSTDCPSGPNEILKGGKWGKLVKVGDHVSMSDAIITVLNGEKFVPSYSDLIDLYGIENITDLYLKLLISKKN
jgi:glycosyltransferase involved in cell wall biosynthesis